MKGKKRFGDLLRLILLNAPVFVWHVDGLKVLDFLVNDVSMESRKPKSWVEPGQGSWPEWGRNYLAYHMCVCVTCTSALTLSITYSVVFPVASWVILGHGLISCF